MNDHIVSENMIRQFREYLMEQEKAEATVKKYIRDLEQIKDFLGGSPVTKARLIEYRRVLSESCQAVTVNGKLSAINSYLQYWQVEGCAVKLLKIQKNSFLQEDQELKEQEYKKLLKVAQEQRKERLYHLLLTICSTGIRVSELKFITVETLERGRAEIRMKGKNRTMLLPGKLVQKLSCYVRKLHIKKGVIFCTRSGKAVDRSNICREMKKLAEAADICRKKVYPHNLRHLFARQFYAVHKNIAHLADVLGHSYIETTRIYVAVSASEHERTMESMNLVV